MREEVNVLRTYEALYIVRPDLEDDEIQTIAKEVESLITADGGAIVRSEIWGKRRLSYEVNKFTEGCYILVRFEALPTFVARLENHFRLTDAIIRYLVVHFDERMLRLEISQKKRKEAELHAGPPVRRRRDDDDDDEAPRDRKRKFDDDGNDDEAPRDRKRNVDDDDNDDDAPRDRKRKLDDDDDDKTDVDVVDVEKE